MTSFVKINPDDYHFYIDRILEIENLSFLSPWSLLAFLEEIKKLISHLWGATENGILAVHPKKRSRGLDHYLLTNMIEGCI